MTSLSLSISPDFLFIKTVIGTPHLLLCILRNFDDPITKILNELDVTYETVKNEYNNYLFKKEKKNNVVFVDTILLLNVEIVGLF